MTWWLTVRGARAMAIAVAVVLVLMVVVGDLAIPMMSLAILAEIALPVSLVAPVALAIVVTWSLARGDERLEGVAAQPVGPLDAGLVLATAGGFACLAVALDIGGLTNLGLEAARNALRPAVAEAHGSS